MKIILLGTDILHGLGLTGGLLEFGTGSTLRDQSLTKTIKPDTQKLGNASKKPVPALPAATPSATGPNGSGLSALVSGGNAAREFPNPAKHMDVFGGIW